jgi:hypothetical protein
MVLMYTPEAGFGGQPSEEIGNAIDFHSLIIHIFPKKLGSFAFWAANLR